MYGVFIVIHFATMEISNPWLTSFAFWNMFFIKGSDFPFAKYKYRKCFNVFFYGDRLTFHVS